MSKRWFLNTVYLILVGLSVLATANGVLYNTHNKRVDIFEVNYIDQSTFNSLTSIFKHYNMLEDTIFWKYDKNHTTRRFVAATHDVDSRNFSTLSISDRIIYQKMLLFHTNRMCFTTRVVDLPDDTTLKQLISSKSDTNNPNLFYVSCPVHVNDKLFGYVSSIFENKNNGVAIYLNNVELLAQSVSLYIKGKL